MGGWEEGSEKNPMDNYADMLIMDFFCVHPPVVILSALQLTSLPHPHPPRCLALGCSSVCCKQSVPPAHQATPGRKKYSFSLVNNENQTS